MFILTEDTGKAESLSADMSVGRFRRTDPVTSKVAAVNAERFASSHAGRIVAALRALSTATAAELAQESGLAVVQIDRRRKEMEQAGQVYMLRQGGKLFTRDGFMVWALTPDACYFSSSEAHA